jgi:choline/glycine/proline betaine transport protein
MAALPVSVLMILMCVAIWRQLHGERRARVRAERRRYTRELAEEVSQHMIDEGLVEERPNGGPAAGEGLPTGEPGRP